MKSYWALGVFITSFLYTFPLEGEGQRVVQLGNPLTASASGIDELPQPGVIFLMHDVILTEGVVFAISAFFRSQKRVRLQIWRPQDASGLASINTEQAFHLLFEMQVTPSVLHAREDLYIESSLIHNCVRVKQGDRLGVYLEQSPGAVAYKFDENNPEALGYTFKDKNRPIFINETVNFDLLKFPYDFSLAAYIDTDLNNYNSDLISQPCPKGLLIPDHLKPTLGTIPPTSPIPTTTLKPGATGAVGPPGEPGTIVGPKGPDGFPGPPGPAGVPGKEGSMGPNGLDGNKGPLGNAGPAGPAGSVGIKGTKGLRGDEGPRGKPGEPGHRVRIVKGKEVAVASTTGGLDRNHILIATIWLAVVSAIIIIIIIVIVVIKCRDRKYYRERLPSAGSDFKPSWMEVLSEEETEQYRSPSAPSSPDHLPTYAFDNEAMSEKDRFQ